MTNVMPKLTARQRVLAYLRSHPPASAAEIAQALGVGPAAARHHLRLLQADGRARVEETRSAPGQAGPPERLYTLGQVLPDAAYASLAQAALTGWFSCLLPEQIPAAAQSLAQKLLPLGKLILPQWASSRKLTALTEALTERGYQARWEARRDGPQLILERCPFAAIVDDQPALCLMDRLALEDALNLPAQQTARREKNALGGRVCVFRLGG